MDNETATREIEFVICSHYVFSSTGQNQLLLTPTIKYLGTWRLKSASSRKWPFNIVTKTTALNIPQRLHFGPQLNKMKSQYFLLTYLQFTAKVTIFLNYPLTFAKMTWPRICCYICAKYFRFSISRPFTFSLSSKMICDRISPKSNLVGFI
jgi:hypothetical protein